MIRKLLLIPVLALGVGIAIWMISTRSEIPERTAPERAADVRVMTIAAIDVQPRAVGYGEVRPGRVWNAVPQVAGRIVHLSPRVREGKFVRAGELLVRIDASEYELDVQLVEARIAALEAQLQELSTREETIEASLELERASLDLAEAEVVRSRELVEKGTVSRADLDLEERNVLAQKVRVQEIENSRTLLGPQRAVITAQLAQERASLERTRLSVSRTEISAPFDCRIGPVSVEQAQVVQIGQQLFSADATDVSEVTAWVPLQGARHVLAAGTADIAAIVVGQEDVARQLGLSAVIRFGIGPREFAWPGEVVRIRGIDSRTRALGVDVAVRGPYANLNPSRRPPLVPDLFVRVAVHGRTIAGRIAVPRSAVHGESVRLVGEDGRLALRPVAVEFVQDEYAVLSEGLEPGDRVVLSDVVPAVPGTLLRVHEDEEAHATMTALLGEEKAAGEGEEPR